MLQKLQSHRRRFVRGSVAVALLVLAGLSAVMLRRIAQPSDWHVAPHRFVTAAGGRDELLERATLAAAIDRSTEYLIRACEQDGRFVYCRDLERPQFRSPQYNVLRHAGAIYALCQRHAWRPHPEVPDAVERAVAFLRRETFMRVPGRDELLAVWSLPELIRRAGPPEAKLGGTGLGLVALVHAESIRPGLTPPDELKALGDFLIWMQRSDGSFYAKFIPSAGGRRSDWISLYYPGEAALGLVRLYELNGDRRYADAARRALLYLADSRRGQSQVPADHWALLATESLLGAAGSIELAGDERQRLITHAVQVVTSILSEQVRSTRSPYTFGGFTADGRTTPTATRVEGLTAALAFLPEQEGALRREIERACGDAVRFLLTAQVQHGPLTGGIPRAIGRQRPLWSQSTREANQRATEIRVDYVQHALSAWIQYAVHRGVVPH